MKKDLAYSIASRFSLQPALISPAHSSIITSTIRQLCSIDDSNEDARVQREQREMLLAYGYEPSPLEKPFAYADGIAFIPMTGMLINRCNFSWGGWITGYNYIRSLLRAAVEDADVKLIVFDCNSPGGEVAGCFELSNDIRESRSVKPSLAIVDSACYSACYALASAATKIGMAPSAGAGSIGVLATHVSVAKMLEDVGYEVTLIYSGAHKVDGNPFEQLPAPVRKNIQTRVDETRAEFAALVAKNRSLDEKVVLDTEAMCYTASEAIDIGLADFIASPLEAIQDFFSLTVDCEDDMNDKENQAAAAPAAAATNAETPATPVNAAAAATENASCPAAAAVAQPNDRKAERDRISAIINHDEAKDKSRLAHNLALNTELSVDDAVAALKAAAPEVKQEASAFTAAMEASAHPAVAAEGGEAGGESAAQRILKAQALASGK